MHLYIPLRDRQGMRYGEPISMDFEIGGSTKERGQNHKRHQRLHTSSEREVVSALRISAALVSRPDERFWSSCLS